MRIWSLDFLSTLEHLTSASVDALNQEKVQGSPNKIFTLEDPQYKWSCSGAGWRWLMHLHIMWNKIILPLSIFLQYGRLCHYQWPLHPSPRLVWRIFFKISFQTCTIPSSVLQNLFSSFYDTNQLSGTHLISVLYHIIWNDHQPRLVFWSWKKPIPGWLVRCCVKFCWSAPLFHVILIIIALIMEKL